MEPSQFRNNLFTDLPYVEFWPKKGVKPGFNPDCHANICRFPSAFFHRSAVRPPFRDCLRKPKTARAGGSPGASRHFSAQAQPRPA
jgi:hypothetical protein